MYEQIPQTGKTKSTAMTRFGARHGIVGICVCSVEKVSCCGLAQY